MKLLANITGNSIIVKSYGISSLLILYYLPATFGRVNHFFLFETLLLWFPWHQYPLVLYGCAFSGSIWSSLLSTYLLYFDVSGSLILRSPLITLISISSHIWCHYFIYFLYVGDPQKSWFLQSKLNQHTNYVIHLCIFMSYW